MSDTITPLPRPAVIPALCYVDARKAFNWLQQAFGFEIEFIIEDEGGNLVHSELRHGNGVIMVGTEWDADTKSPRNTDNRCTTTTHIHIEEDIDAHCAHARASGAEIMMEPETQFYGDRTYRARDLEGHIWTFGQTIEIKTPEQWDEGTGLKTTMGKPAA